jgi:hypothetical protein
MNVDNLRSVLAFNREVLRRALPSFIRSVEKCKSLELSLPMPFEVEESFDALTTKFARVSDIFTQKVLKSYAMLTREEAPTFLDRMHLCEKLGIIPSADEMITIRDMRNLIAHEYLTENLLEVYAESLSLSDKLLHAIRQADAALNA